MRVERLDTERTAVRLLAVLQAWITLAKEQHDADEDGQNR